MKSPLPKREMELLRLAVAGQDQWKTNPFDAATPAMIECYEANQAFYQSGKAKPNYPMPAIPLAVKYDYTGCINIDDMSDANDPTIVYMYDSWTGQNV